MVEVVVVVVVVIVVVVVVVVVVVAAAAAAVAAIVVVNGSLVLFGKDMELDALGRQFRTLPLPPVACASVVPCGVTWDAVPEQSWY